MIRKSISISILTLMAVISCKDGHIKPDEKSNSVSDLHYDRAEALFKEGDLFGALAELQSSPASRLSKMNSRREFLKGVIYQNRHRYKSALESYDRYLRSIEEPRSDKSDKSVALNNMAKAHFELGLLYKNMSRFADEISTSLALSKAEVSERAKLKTMAMSHFESAAYSYGQAGLEPTEKNYISGVCHLESGRLHQAIKAFDSVLNNGSGRLKSKAEVKLGEAYYRKGFHEKALQLWGEAIRANSEDVEVKLDIAQTYCHLGINLRQALQSCDAIESKRPGFTSKIAAAIYMKLGSQNRDAEMLSQAIRLFEKNRIQESGYHLDSNDPILLVNLTEAYYKRQKFGEAANIIAHFLHEYPESGQILDAIQTMSEIRRRTSNTND